MFLFIGVILLMLGWWVQWRARRRRLVDLADQLPGPPTVPLLGNALLFNRSSKEILSVLGELKKQYGRAFRVWLGPDLNYCISEPEDVKSLLQSTKTNEKGTQYKYIINVLGDGLLSGSGAVWRKTRKTLSPNYSPKAVENYSNVFNEETDFLLERLRARPAEVFNIYTEFVKTTTHTVCQTLFGLSREETLSLPHLQEIVHETHEMYENIFRRMTTWYLQIEPIYWLTLYPRTNKFVKKVKQMSETIVKHRIKRLDETSLNELNEHFSKSFDKQTNFSMVDKLILKKSVPDYDEMLKQIFAIFTTSQETTANMSSFILLMLAHHPECQEKLYAELKEVLGEEDRHVTDEDVKRMPYLDMVCKEILRLFPLGTMLQRTIMEDIEIGNGVTLPAGSSLTVPIFHMHRDEEFWPNPDAFDPERFSPERSVGRHPCCFLPFSLGFMDCLGRHFAIKLVKTICARVLREFKVTSPETYADLQILCAVSVESVNGYPVLLSPRVN